MYFSSKVLWIQSSLYMSHFLTHAFTMCYKHMARWQCMTRMSKVWCKKKKILPRTLRSCLPLYLFLSKSDVFCSIHFLEVSLYLKRLLFLHLTETQSSGKSLVFQSLADKRLRLNLQLVYTSEECRISVLANSCVFLIDKRVLVLAACECHQSSSSTVYSLTRTAIFIVKGIKRTVKVLYIYITRLNSARENSQPLVAKCGILSPLLAQNNKHLPKKFLCVVQELVMWMQACSLRHVQFTTIDIANLKILVASDLQS